jgi:hypothetical protein
MDNTKETKAKSRKRKTLLNVCIVNTPLQVKVSKDTHVRIGQGEGDTK